MHLKLLQFPHTHTLHTHSLSLLKLFKGKFYHCEGLDTRNITNKSDCLQANYSWIRRKYNFDNLIQVRMDGRRQMEMDFIMLLLLLFIPALDYIK